MYVFLWLFVHSASKGLFFLFMNSCFYVYRMYVCAVLKSISAMPWMSDIL